MEMSNMLIEKKKKKEKKIEKKNPFATTRDNVAYDVRVIVNPFATTRDNVAYDVRVIVMKLCIRLLQREIM
jgi:hypothetical protein